MTQASQPKLTKFVNWRMKVVMNEKRSFIGTFLAFDRHLNIVLADCDEYRKTKSKDGQEKELKRHLGLIILRGENVISITVDSPPLPAARVPEFKQPQGTAATSSGPRLGLQPQGAPMGLTGHVQSSVMMPPLPGMPPMMPGMPPMMAGMPPPPPPPQ